MKKTFLIICAIIFSLNHVIAQKDSLIIKPRLHEKKNLEDSAIKIGNQDLYFSENNNYNLSFLKDSLVNASHLRQYKTMVFRYSNRNSKTIYYLHQWSVPIVIYFDKSFPKEIKSEFEIFYSKFNNINNLSISFTNNIEKANYYFKVTENPINAYDADYEFDSEEEKENSVLTGATYSLMNFDNKFYSGVLFVNEKQITNHNKLIKQLKQLFFMSLGSFYLTSSKSKTNSLLSKKYTNSQIISERDIAFMKIHYANIFSQKIDSDAFQEILNLNN